MHVYVEEIKFELCFEANQNFIFNFSFVKARQLSRYGTPHQPHITSEMFIVTEVARLLK